MGFSPVVGTRFKYVAKPMPGWSGIVECEVLEVREPFLLRYTWLGGEKDDVTLGDSAPELVVKTVDERSDTVSLAHCKAFHWKERVITVPRPLSPGASRARMEGKQKRKGE